MIHRPTASITGHTGTRHLAAVALLAGLNAAVLGGIVALALLVG
jgi:hypothetical protein